MDQMKNRIIELQNMILSNKNKEIQAGLLNSKENKKINNTFTYIKNGSNKLIIKNDIVLQTSNKWGSFLLA